MLARAIEHRPASAWPAGESSGSLTLDYDARHRRRIRLTTDAGENVLLDLPQAAAMADGDGLRLDDGRWLCVRAAPEALVEVRVGEPRALARVAWHLGNRHLPAEILDGAIRIRPDHVIEAMLRGLLRGAGAAMAPVVAPFQPEGGAYGGQRHGHGHDDNHGH
jgi:urease accessory protein